MFFIPENSQVTWAWCFLMMWALCALSVLRAGRHSPAAAGSCSMERLAGQNWRCIQGAWQSCLQWWAPGEGALCVCTVHTQIKSRERVKNHSGHHNTNRNKQQSMNNVEYRLRMFLFLHYNSFKFVKFYYPFMLFHSFQSKI